MDAETKLELIKRPPTEEVITEADLKIFIDSGEKLNHYIGFEISGPMHLGTGMGCMAKVVDLQKAGVNCSVFLADWHAWINNKLGGDWNNIQKAIEYYMEGFKACIKAWGGSPAKVKFVRGSDLYHNNDDYWKSVIDISKNVSIGRIMRSITIMGRKEKDLTSFAQLIYPPMQVADLFAQRVHIAHAGLDQRKAHVIAREVASKLEINKLEVKGKRVKPVALHHHLILGLQKPDIWPIPDGTNKQEIWASMKMSKSKTNTAIMITDSEEDIKKKVTKAFCPEKEVEFNPLIDWAEHLVFRRGVLEIKRPERFGGDVTFDNIDELKKYYSEGKLHPADLKNGMTEALISMLAPVREHFKSRPNLINMFEKFEVTR